MTDTEIEGWIKEEHVAMTSDIMERTRKLSVINLLCLLLNYVA